MCLILFAFKASAEYPLVVAGNRDEAYARPTATAAFWQDHPHIYAGRDLELGGTWMGLTRGGRFAAVTNFRDGYPNGKGAAPRSRGDLAGGFLTSDRDAHAYLDTSPRGKKNTRASAHWQAISMRCGIFPITAKPSKR